MYSHAEKTPSWLDMMHEDERRHTAHSKIPRLSLQSSKGTRIINTQHVHPLAQGEPGRRRHASVLFHRPRVAYFVPGCQTSARYDQGHLVDIGSPDQRGSWRPVQARTVQASKAISQRQWPPGCFIGKEEARDREKSRPRTLQNAVAEASEVDFVKHLPAAKQHTSKHALFQTGKTDHNEMNRAAVSRLPALSSQSAATSATQEREKKHSKKRQRNAHDR